MASENEKRETLANILAEMLDFSDKRIEEGRDHAMTSESVGLIVHQLARRFEAAWKREREELNKRISDLEAYAKLWTSRADELRLKCDEFYAKAKHVGNAAAMREALVLCSRIIGANGIHGNVFLDDIEEAHRAITAALSAPARNCDRFSNADQAVGAYRQTHKNMIVNVFLDWLFAPAAERKGEGDGIK